MKFLEFFVKGYIIPSLLNDLEVLLLVPDQVKLCDHFFLKTLIWKIVVVRSLLNKVLQVPKCLSARVPECLSAQVPFECPSPQVSEFPSALSARVPECPNAQVLQVPKCLECPSALRVPNCLKGPSAKVPECLECLKCWSASVSQLAIQPLSQLVCNSGSVS